MSSDVPVNSSSPDWKRPPKVITIKRRKKNGQSTNKLTVPDGVLRTRNAGDASEDARMKSKRRNPFGCGSLPKRANVGTSGSVRTLSSDREEDNMTGPDVEGKLLAGLSQLDEEQKLQTPSLSADVHQKRPATDDPLNGGPTIDAEPPKDSQAQVEEKETPESLTQVGSRELPEDLSLKSRVRFTSPHPFSWCSRIKTTDEASGVCGFVRGQEKNTLADPESWASSFQQCVMTWIHPNLPWLRLFPRIVSTSRKVDSKGPPATIIPNIQEALLSDWTNSFRSVFQLLKAQMCPYFYVCGHQFTVLFHGVQTGGAKSLGALLTPTSRGLREALDNEGVSFKMPLAARQSGGSDPSRKLSTDGKQDDGASEACPEKSEKRGDMSDEDDDDDDDITIDDSGASCWLESMGLDKSSFPELDPRKVKVQRSKMKSIDHFPESLVQVSGGDTQALFNFLINSKSLVTQSGPLAGVPPTLLAPVAFEGATLRALKVKQGSIRQTIAGKLTQVNSLEVSGPLLPCHVQQLCSLFQHSQHGDFSTVFSTHEATATFNRLRDTESMIVEENSMTKELRTEDIKELVCEKGLYKWTS
ncbi:PREDICTED: protein downstream neighbor of son homolog [Branchiostoma belcheri]|uniref:Protein downstream neighbor of son homolog n=1 Tax=Branchiostoma belcheri TaxID=7741 RepID=A0A6P4Z135_BRABE|nr:PREDICTED: protein downstream neighbor of son homolog [Branchiostoma belcheri]